MILVQSANGSSCVCVYEREREHEQWCNTSVLYITSLPVEALQRLCSESKEDYGTRVCTAENVTVDLVQFGFISFKEEGTSG